MTQYTIHRESPQNLRIDYKKELNEEQLDVVMNGDGACLVLAGAGSGKTRTIVYRVAYLLETGVRPENILLVTFTNKAAREMLDRITQIFGTYPKGVWGGTFHHVAHILLRKYAGLIGFANNFTIIDADDAEALLKIVIKELHPNPPKGRFPSASVIYSIISFAKNTRVTVAQVIADKYPTFLPIQTDIEQIAKSFASRKKQSHHLDFDDMLYYLLVLLDISPEAKNSLSKMFQYILVDEYQDTNRLQADIVTRLAGQHGNILVVGDDAQSIYSFRGAEIQNILQFPKLFPNTKTFRIETNYRSTPEILNLANNIISNNKKQYPKKLKSIKSSADKPWVVALNNQTEEAEFITQRILELHHDGAKLSEIAVLFRAAHHSQALEFELTRKEIPYEYRGGIRFFERAHIKDVLAYLKVIENIKDEISWRRILKHQEGIGETGAKKITDWIMQFNELAQLLTNTNLPLKSDSRAGIGFNKLIKNIQSLNVQEKLPQILIKAILESDYKSYLENEFVDAVERLADLETLSEFSGQYSSLSTFLAELTLQESFNTQQGEDKDDDDKLILSTIHQAKGLEWDSVFVINLASDSFPGIRAQKENNIEEERRLFYVATTRAKKNLYISYAISLNSMTTGFATMRQPSIFLQELPQTDYEAVDIMIDFSDQFDNNQDLS